MANMQGSGKIRLIAKKGRYQEDANSARLRNLSRELGLSGENRDLLMRDATSVNGEDTGLENYYIEFDVTPDITETGSVAYFEAGEIRGPGSILMYMGSPSRTFSINAKLVARNVAEAKRVAKQIHILKSWRMPESYTGGINAGTPTLLYLQGYGKMFKDIPCVLTDLSIEFSSEHDFIKNDSSHLGIVTQQAQVTGRNPDGSPISQIDTSWRVEKFDSAVPIIVPVSISLKEAHSVEGEMDGLEKFDILKYRTGNLAGW